MKKTEDLVQIVNIAKDAADRSAFGPLFLYPDERDVTNKQVNQLCYGVFTIVLTAMLRDLKKDSIDK